MSPTLKAFLVAGSVMAAGAAIGYGAFRMVTNGGESVLNGSVTSPLRDGFTRSHLIPPSSPSNFDAPYDSILGTNAAFGLYLNSVDPDCGPFEGGTQVTIGGDFSIIPASLTVAEATAAYWVYFGGVLTTFDSTASPAVVAGDPGEFRVVTPVAPTTGPVDVTLISIVDGYYGNLADSFTYFEPFNLFEVDPVSGPASGGNPVQIRPDGTPANAFPIHAPITTAAEAASFYRVLFGTNVATFDDSGGDPISPSAINVFAPAGAPTTTVDITVEEIGNPCNVNTLPNAYTYDGTFALTNITPQFGYTHGGLNVEILGNFDINNPLTLAQAEAAYILYFNAVEAAFREVLGTAMTASVIYAVTPPHLPPTPAPDLADIQVQEIGVPANSAILPDAFEYVALEILDITPTQGPTTGGTGVKITAFIAMGVGTTIDTIAQAYTSYLVYFGNDPLTAVNLAGYDIAFEPPGGPGVIVGPTDPVPDRNDPNALQTAAMMYVVTPGHPAGFVDVLVTNAGLPDVTIPVQDRVVDGFEYQDTGLGEWVGVQIFPPYVGALDPGELLVLIETTTEPSDWSAADVFIVPQGGDPNDPNHRISLDFQGERLVTENFVTEWTNATSIPQILVDNGTPGPDSGDLFTDGHAALYIADPDSAIIYGNNFVDLTDSGRIRDDSANGLLDPVVRRHFIIDTIPPVFIPNPDPAFGSNLVELAPGVLGTLSDILPPPPTLEHPAGIPGTDERATDALVDSESVIPGTSATGFVPGVTGLGAQVFLNTASDVFTNDFPDDDLDITVDGQFVDLDIHTFYGITTTSTLDEDKYDANNTFRQPAGFPTDIETLDRLNQPMGDSVLGGENALWAQWVRAAGSDVIPLSLPVNVNFESAFAGAGGVTTPSDPYFNWMSEVTAVWDFNAGVNNGIPQPPGSTTLHWAIQYRSHDRAGLVTDEAGDIIRLILTPQDQLRDPLHVWWIRNTSALVLPNLEGLEVFDEDITFELNRGIEIPLIETDPDEPFPLFAYRLWRSTVPGRGGYDAAYEPVPGPLANWQPGPSFTPTSQINIQTDIVDVLEGNPGTSAADVVNRWILIQVLGIDEAGNYGQFPVGELTYDFGGTENITSFEAGSGASWMRFFLLEQESSVDTRIRPTIWYDSLTGGTQGQIDPGERVILGAPTVLQAPEDITQQQIRIRFNVEAVTDDLANADIEWSVSRRNSLGATNIDWTTQALGGNATVDIDFARQGTAGARDIGIDLDDEGTGDPAPIVDGGPTALVFRFRTTVTPGASDSSPATYSVTVVDDIEEFIENRRGPDNQPIKETTR